MKDTIALVFTILPLLWASTAAAQRVDVAELQRALAALGYTPGPVNGEWGVETRGALFQFQRDNGFRTSLDIGQDQLLLLGMLPTATPEPERAPVDLEPETATPIVGDLGATMQLYGQLASHIIFDRFRDGAMMNIVTTASNPADIEFVPPDPGRSTLYTFTLGQTGYETSGVTLAASNLQHKVGAAPDLEQYMSPGAQQTAPDRLCDDPSPEATTGSRTHFCIVSGEILFGGTFRLGENIVSCREGSMTVTNANRDHVFAPGTLCSVNGNPVRLSDTGWIEDPA